MSPRKQDTRPTFTLPLARKRIRTESLTSNKSLPEGVTVNKVTRKLATKQEESQRTLDNKKEIRKRLTNIENVDKQNLTMFDMIYYNPVNNPMTPPALSKRGSLENIPKSVDGREGGNGRGSRSRSVSKSRSPTPAPSGSVPVVAAAPKSAAPPAPVTLTPQLKLGPNGEMILDEASLVVENEREREMRETLANTDIVYQDEFSGSKLIVGVLHFFFKNCLLMSSISHPPSRFRLLQSHQKDEGLGRRGNDTLLPLLAHDRNRFLHDADPVPTAVPA